MEKIIKKNFDVQSVGINAPRNDVFEFVANTKNLPLWTKAFAKADDKSAVMVTPNGEMRIELETISSKKFGIVDWVMTMPDRSIGKAFSRITVNGNSTI